MPLTTGTHLGPYVIEAPLGVGGMGEVYRARDARLNRVVALKVLPATLAGDPDRLARMRREAQVLAALNHPNIAHLYGFEDATTLQGAPDAPAALVMELVEGPTLADRIAAGPLPLDEALAIARQIADALESAHEQGIIHRDLKPANVKVREDGTVKVLDFGLAKALTADPASGSAAALDSPTLTAHATQLGVILGTAAYMAPEQAKGRTVDRRADIWAFGAVLYEMLTGRRPFGGDDVSDTLAAVLRADVDWTALPPTTPPALRHLVSRCLERDVRNRLQSIGEARIAIDRLIASPVSPFQSSAPPSKTASTASWRSAAIIGIVGISAVVTALAAVVIWRGSRSVQEPRTVHRYRLPSTLISPGGASSRALSLSPDGQRIVFLADQKLQIWELDQLEPRVLAGAGPLGLEADAVGPIWSPDGQAIAYSSGGKLWRIPAQDGTPTMICTLPSPSGAAWGDDDRIIFSTTRGPMYEVSARGGEPKVFLPLDPKTDVDFHQPFILPGGKGIVYAVHRPSGVDTIEVLSGGTRKVVLRVEGKARRNPQVLNLPQYSPSGHLVYRMDQGNVGIWAVPFSLERLEVTGDPFLVKSGGQAYSVAADGTLVYSSGTDDQPAQLALFRRDGTLDRVLGEPSPLLETPEFSPDGRRVTYVAGDNGTDVWVWDLATNSGTRITFTPDDETGPAWIPGTNKLTFQCGTADGPAICMKAADGSGDTTVVAHKAGPPRSSLDGRYLLYATNGSAARGTMTLDLGDPAALPKPLTSSADEHLPLGFTADGRYAVYWAFESGTPKTFLTPFPAGTSKWEVPNWNIDGPRLRSGGRSVLGMTPRGSGFAVVEVPIDTKSGVTFGVPHDLFTGLPQLVSGGFDVTPDGTRLVALQRLRGRSAPTGIVVVLNWLAETTRAR